MRLLRLEGRKATSFVKRFGRDTRGNVLIISAISIIPMLAMIGGAIDVSRLYMARSRLQQACDAGALAGRKAMADVNTLSTAEKATAKGFFDFNFPNGTYDAANIVANYVRGANQGTVAGTASIVMPTTIMKLFGYTNVSIAVSCESTLQIPNTDVMFVLDVTGSMADTPSGDTVSKIDGLKQAVKDFYGALGPGVATGPGRIRYGFMPYSSNVNVGKLVKAANPAWIVGGNGSENWHYQSRIAVTEPERYPVYGTESAPSPAGQSDGTVTYGPWIFDQRYTRQTYAQCVALLARDTDTVSSSTGPTLRTDEDPPVYPDAVRDRTYTTGEQHAVVDNSAYVSSNMSPGSNNTGDCQLIHRNGTYSRSKITATTTPVTWNFRDKFKSWSYQENTYDVSAIVRNDTGGPNPTYYSGYWTGTDPNLNEGHDASGNYYTTITPPTVSWGGCIEEARTVKTITASSSLTPPADANDLDIDLIPDTTEKRWKPFLPQIQFDSTRDWLGRQNGWIGSGYAACPVEARRLGQYQSDYIAATKSSVRFNSYVDSLSPIGGTTHDIGLIWGARFLSPTGIFGSDNSDAAAPSGSQVSRHIVFMTDGLLDTTVRGNDPWGITKLDGRVAPTSANDDRSDETHNRRVQIICNAMKSKGFTIWVIGFGLSPPSPGQPAVLPQTLADCATDANHASVASSAAALRIRFQTIAETIGGLRLSS